MIYNEWYRDQDLVTERTEDDITIPQIAWEKDYYTTARPWPQKGADITIPIGQAPVLGAGVEGGTYAPATVRQSDGSEGSESVNNALRAIEDPDNPDYPYIYAQGATGTINELREAFALQRFAEARAKYGSRYVEYLRYCGVKSSDARLQRPEYIGGGRVPLSISEVLQTAPEDDTGPQTSTDYGVGDMYGHGIAAMRSNRYRRYFEEHGYVISLISIRPKAMYTDTVPRHWLRLDREDYFQKELQFIGQQAVWTGEVYGGSADPRGTFGYQDRYKEYKFEPSTASGEFRELLNYWHMARQFESEPVLNQSFTDCVPTKRVYAEQTQHDLWMMVQHRVAARRPVSRSNASRVL